jgi:hypothetical protein
MPQLIQRSRLSTWLTNLLGLRGPYSPGLTADIAAVYDLGNRAPELDQEQAFFYLTPTSAGPTAGQFSFAQVKVTAGAGAAVLDALYIRAAAATGVVRFGITPEIAGATSSSLLGNNFLGNRGATYALAGQQLGSVGWISGSQVADPFATAGQAFNYDVFTTTGVLIVLPPLFVVQPGWAFTLAGGVVNQGIGCSMIGRWLADQQ